MASHESVCKSGCGGTIAYPNGYCEMCYFSAVSPAPRECDECRKQFTPNVVCGMPLSTLVVRSKFTTCPECILAKYSTGQAIPTDFTVFGIIASLNAEISALRQTVVAQKKWIIAHNDAGDHDELYEHESGLACQQEEEWKDTLLNGEPAENMLQKDESVHRHGPGEIEWARKIECPQLDVSFYRKDWQMTTVNTQCGDMW
mgnify:CR=1 FL=1